MKTIGLIGGMSWESTVGYYQTINMKVKETLGGFHSAKCILYSVDFHEIEVCQAQGDWEKSGQLLAEAAVALERAGADFIVICTNTMHKVIEVIREPIGIPILHIAEVTAQRLIGHKIHTVGLLGTKYTMEQDFYKGKLVEQGLNVIVPDAEVIKVINDTIYNELCLGIISEQSKAQFLEIVQLLHEQGAQAVILGCTEIGMLIQQEDTDIPLYDTTVIHGESAALLALEGNETNR